MITLEEPNIRPYDSFLVALIKRFRLFFWIARHTGDLKNLSLLPIFRIHPYSIDPYFDRYVCTYHLFKGRKFLLSCQINHDQLFCYSNFYFYDDWKYIKEVANESYKIPQKTFLTYSNCPHDDIPF